MGGVPTKSEVGRNERTQSERHVTNGTEVRQQEAPRAHYLGSTLRNATEGGGNFFLLYVGRYVVYILVVM